MQIIITNGVGSAKTELASFDAALFDAGIANYNLIQLSSVIPSNAEILIKNITKYNSHEYGYKLYLVLAKKIADKPGEDAVAGIGWIKHNDNNGSGLFVEFGSNSEDDVKQKIKDTLGSMCSYRPEEAGDVNMVISKIKCIDKPVCALVAAVYKVENWD